MREYVRDHERLEHMLEAIDRILIFADGKTMEEMEAEQPVILRNCQKY